MIEVFVSHTHKDKDLVEALKLKIKGEFGESIKLFISSDNNSGPDPGTKWHEWIDNRIDNCNLMLVVITSNTKTSEWIGNEMGYARGKKKEIVPIRVNSECPIPGTASTIQVIKDDENNSDKFTDKLYDQIFNVLRKKLSEVNEHEKATNLLSIIVAGPVGFLAKKLVDEIRRK